MPPLLDCQRSAFQDLSDWRGEQDGKARQAWGEWLANLRPWEWFVTLTFKPPQEGIYDRRGVAYTKRAVQAFQDQALAGCRPYVADGDKAYVQVEGVWAIERHLNLAPHVHGLLAAKVQRWDEWAEVVRSGGPGLGRRLDMVDWSWETTGMARVEAVNDLGAAHYVSKYIMKGGPECLILNVTR